MTEMITVQQDFNTPTLDAHIEHSRKQQAEIDKNQKWKRKHKFEPPRLRSRVFTGREEINYENV